MKIKTEEFEAWCDPKFEGRYGVLGSDRSDSGKELYRYIDSGISIRVFDEAFEINGEVIPYRDLTRFKRYHLRDIMLVSKSLGCGKGTELSAELTLKTSVWKTFKIPYFLLIPMHGILAKDLALESDEP